MGVCSYCKKYRDEHEECFGWNEAKTFCGVTRPEPSANPPMDKPVANMAGEPVQKMHELDHIPDVCKMVEAVDRDMIARGDRIGAKLARELLAHYDAAESRVQSLEEEVKRLRQVVSKCAAALPNGAFIHPQLASIEFMEKLPGEIASVCAALKENGNG